MFKKLFIVILFIFLILNLKTRPTKAKKIKKVSLNEKYCYKKMSLDEKIGQMMCMDFTFWNNKNSKQMPVLELNDEIREIIAKYHIGNIILFSQSIKDKKQIKELIEDFQNTAISSKNPPLIIATDQEGGRVEKFAFDRKKLKDNREIKTSEEAFEKGKIIGKELREIGINCDFAPVVDVNNNPENQVIGSRSFGDNPEIVSELAKNFMKGLHTYDIISTAKHFPGHGSTKIDSHVALPKNDKTLNEIENMELKPFKVIIDSGINMIMTAHIQFPKIEGKTIISKKDGKEFFLPATVSRTMLTELLRNKMNFKGVIITDAMNMKAISDNFDEAEAVKMAIHAGADIVCMPTSLRSKTDTSKLDKIFEIIKNAVKNGEILEEQINESVKRILKLKNKFIS